MRSANFYPRLKVREKSAKSYGFGRTFLLAGLLMAFLPFIGRSAPAFLNGGGFQYFTICGGAPISINSWLAAPDPVLFHTDTWTVVLDPANGSLAGFPYSQGSGGSGIPSGLIYIPPADPLVTSDNFTITVDDGINPPAYIFVILTINPGPAVTIGTVNPVCSGVSSATLPFSNLVNVGPDTATFNYTGIPQTFTVPANITNVKFDLMGASGGNNSISADAPAPGKGGRLQGTLSVTPFQVLNLYVGGVGGDGTVTGGVGGYNGGANSNYYFYGCGGAGGGATDIRIGGTNLSNRRVVAGGGAGDGAEITPSSVFLSKAGGNGGGLIGGSSALNPAGSSPSTGGTQSSGGAPSTYFGWTPGGFGTSGNGGMGSTAGISGGGGGGYFGGGGGVWMGGGGGSSFANNTLTTAVTHTQGANTGDGMATIYYTVPGTYTIIWDTAAFDSGFVNVANVILPPNNQIDFAVPPAVTPGTYYGTLTVTNSTCTSPGYHFAVTVKPIPTVGVIPDQVLCNGDSTTDVSLFTDVSGGSVTWTNDNPAIGLDPSGSGHIPKVLPVNTTNDPIIANIAITPQANGCIGVTQTIHITDNPVPMLNSTATPTRVCNNGLFSYNPNSLTVGTAFTWTRSGMADITNPAASGNDNPNETLTNTGLNPVNVVYVYTLTANGCTNTVNVTVPVEPTPVMTSTLTIAPICNSTPFNYHATSSTAVAVLNWSRATTTGISNGAASGTGDINETLINTTNVPKVANYVYAMDVNGCITTQSLPVTVNPTPALLGSLTEAHPICDSDLSLYVPMTNVTGIAIAWSRPAITGITPATNSGTGSISEILRNTSTDPITVNYIYTSTANSCAYTQTVTVTVNPRPKLTTTLTPPGICTNTMFNYSPMTLTAGTTIAWARDSVQGISNGPVTGTNSVHEVLYSTVDTVVHVTYLYTLTANGCPNSQAVVVPVNALPRLSNDVSALAICDSTKFDFNPTSNTLGASFAWTRHYQAGVSNLDATGTGNPGEYLNNTTYISVDVPYSFVISAAGCSNTQNISVSVRPSPVLSTSHTAAACTTLPFSYVPLSYTPLSTFAWSRASVSGVTPATASGTGTIKDTLTLGSATPATVVYVYTVTVNGTTCSNIQKVTVTVNPGPAAPVIATHPSPTLCNNTTYLNFGADAPPAAGLNYYWTASNATVVSQGTDRQYAVVSFSNPGTAVITLTSQVGATSCITSTSYTVTVGEGNAETPALIYFQGQFICEQTNVTSYQWGYDNATSLDSTILVGETNQNYANQFPDWVNNRYWVMTTYNGCTQKTYYNKPTTVTDLNTDVAMKVYPNPATNYVNVEVNSLVNGNISVEVSNMLGQKISNVQANDHKAQIDVAGLPAGCYLVDCFSDGVKIAAARFIKN